MALTMHYSISARDVLYHPEMKKRFAWMRQAGVNRIWLDGFFYGRHESDPEDIYQARLRVLEEGFETGVISLPVGHPGNSLNPDDPDLDLAIHPAWRYRVDKMGQKEYFCACIEETMIRHNRQAAEMYAQMGFDRHFFDDDLRLGNWGEQVRGCFCDNCIAAFNQKHGLKLSRSQLAVACEGEEEFADIRRAWVAYNCEKLTDFMVRTCVPGLRSGIMVMHNGGPLHGISIPDIRSRVPGCMFRVGELHFDDQNYLAPGGQQSLSASVKNHLTLIGDNEAYSESTVFPARALAPENLLHRIRLEIDLGLRNIFLMSGTWFLSGEYWEMLKKNRAMLQEYAAWQDAN